MSLLKFLHGSNTSTTYHCDAFMFSSLSHYSLHFVLLVVIVKVNIITKKDKHALRHLYRTRSKTKIMRLKKCKSKIKDDMEAMKDQMTSMMEAVLSMKQMMENNVAAVTATSVAAKIMSCTS